MQLLASLTGVHKKPALDGETNNNSRYRCVEVHPDSEGRCAAVRHIEGRRFLSTEVPRLPLEACDARHCRCSYRLLEDRRTRSRRASDQPFHTVLRSCDRDDRRHISTGRRYDD